MPLPGLTEFLQELESHCHTQAIATFLNGQGESLGIELTRHRQWVEYGEHHTSKALFMAKLINGCEPVASLILRSLTSEIDELTQLPIKEIRGYILQRHGDDLSFEKLPPTTMFACHNTDAETGEVLPLEQSVRYC
ncbi:MAG: hypothetical protein KME06_03155 [Kastovskya adunca ATA6-11-RM4]|jgi:hypothetical protein|nr:hypothetical protein [Kastovskya adunca ATA6-11-RM4]